MVLAPREAAAGAVASRPPRQPLADGAWDDRRRVGGNGAVNGNWRRTVTITGRGAERNLPPARPTLRRYERPGFKPDRAALWAFVLGVLLILVAATTAHAALAHHIAVQLAR